MTHSLTHLKKYTLLSNFLLISALVLPAPVYAHAIMVRSTPEKDAVLTESPKQVDVWFNDKVGTEYKALAVIDSKGKRVDNKDLVQEPADHLYATVPNLPPDTYTVRYRVVSIDTHIVTGKYQFTIKAP
ncbi:Copper transport protein YcnJ [Patescibacteria group bacterium]|nr:Copper transport protein YcnJ [Patescibacteria group bacterium]